MDRPPTMPGSSGHEAPAAPRLPWRHAIAALLLAALALSVFWPATEYAFIEEFDDSQYLTRNPWMRLPPGAQALHWAFTSTAYAANWHPVTWLSHFVDVWLFGFDPHRHHLVNLLWHAANTALLFLLLRGLTGKAGRSAFVAALFAAHPLHVESVAWIAERKDLLSTFFSLLSIGAYLRYARRPGPGRLLPVALWLALALMSKPMAVSLPLALLLLDYWPLGRLTPAGPGPAPVGRRWAAVSLVLEKAPLLLLAATAAVITLVAQRQGQAIRSLDAYPFGARLANAVVSAATYLARLLWPRDLAFYYPFPAAPLPGWEIAAAAALLAGVTALALVRARRQPWLPFGWSWYALTLAPVVGIVQVGDQAMADRYTYLPFVGIFVLLAWTGAETIRTPARRLPGLAWIISAVTVAALSLAARHQLAFWKDDLTLLGRALAVTRDNFLVENNLGNALAREGRVAEAADRYRESLRIRPGFALAHYNLANLMRDQRRTDEALRHYQEALRADPAYVSAYNNLGNLLAAQGRGADAERTFRKGLTIDANNPSLCNNLGSLLLRMGRTAEARELLERAVRIRPDDNNTQFNLADALERLGLVREAAAHFEAALRIRPDDREARARLERAQRRLQAEAAE